MLPRHAPQPTSTTRPVTMSGVFCLNRYLTPPFKPLSWGRLSGPFLKPLYQALQVPPLPQHILCKVEVVLFLEANQSRPLCAASMHTASHCSPGVCLIKCELLLCVTKEGSGCLCRCLLLKCECLLSLCISVYSSSLASCLSITLQL